jgi:histidinol-phosphate aminotransferase
LATWLGVGAEHVAVGPGSVGLLWQLAQVFLDERGEMVAPWPSFEGYPIAAQLMGARLRRVPLVDQQASVPDLLDAITERTKLLVVAEPNNPTGTRLGDDALRALVQGTAGRCLLVIDEAYLEFDPSVDERRSVRFVEQNAHVIVLRTFSKAHGLAGLRVGYAVARPEIVELLDRVAPPFARSRRCRRPGRGRP